MPCNGEIETSESITNLENKAIKGVEAVGNVDKTYNGEVITNNPVKKKGLRLSKLDWAHLAIWYLGILLSFVPAFMDYVLYMGVNDKLDSRFWVQLCLKGDLTWIFATVAGMTLIDNFRIIRTGQSLFLTICYVASLIMYAVDFGVGIVIKYKYPDNYEGIFVVKLVFFVLAVTIVVCSPLHIKEAEK